MCRARYYQAYPCVGITPNCCILPRLSTTFQCSTTLPLARRAMSMDVIVTYLLVGGMPINFPCCATPSQAGHHLVPFSDLILKREAQIRVSHQGHAEDVF